MNEKRAHETGLVFAVFANESNDEWNNRFALFRIFVGEFFLVGAMFLLRPDSHLESSRDREQNSRQRLRHQRKANPRAHFVRVVGT